MTRAIGFTTLVVLFPLAEYAHASGPPGVVPAPSSLVLVVGAALAIGWWRLRK